jgi:hypothetical protein
MFGSEPVPISEPCSVWLSPLYQFTESVHPRQGGGGRGAGKLARLCFIGPARHFRVGGCWSTNLVSSSFHCPVPREALVGQQTCVFPISGQLGGMGELLLVDEAALFRNADAENVLHSRSPNSGECRHCSRIIGLGIWMAHKGPRKRESAKSRRKTRPQTECAGGSMLGGVSVFRDFALSRLPHVDATVSDRSGQRVGRRAAISANAYRKKSATIFKPGIWPPPDSEPR